MANEKQSDTKLAAPEFVQPDGSVQIVTFEGLAGVTRSIDQVFLSAHPGTRFTVKEGDNYSSMAALTFNRSAVAPLGCEYTRIGLGDNLKIAAEPLGFRLAHASLQPGAAVPTLGVIVNQANPITSLSLSDLARIFTVGASGGDLAIWSQVGAKGDVGDRTIHPFGPLATDYTDSEDPQVGEFLGNRFGGLTMTHNYVGLPRYDNVVQRVREDPSAIGIVALNRPLDGVKVLPLKYTASSKPIAPTADQIAAGHYPLDRFVYLYVRIPKSGSAAPFALDYIRSALSVEGQNALTHETSGYIPLNANELTTERDKLER